jgi:protein AaeX
MTYTEIDLFGVYVAPIAPMIVAAWVLLLPLRRLADRYCLLRHVWHPALFLFAVYLILLSVIVVVAAPFAGTLADRIFG